MLTNPNEPLTELNFWTDFSSKSLFKVNNLVSFWYYFNFSILICLKTVINKPNFKKLRSKPVMVCWDTKFSKLAHLFLLGTAQQVLTVIRLHLMSHNGDAKPLLNHLPPQAFIAAYHGIICCYPCCKWNLPPFVIDK